MEIPGTIVGGPTSQRGHVPGLPSSRLAEVRCALPGTQDPADSFDLDQCAASIAWYENNLSVDRWRRGVMVLRLAGEPVPSTKGQAQDQPTVLIIDDDADLRSSLGSLLRSVGMQVRLFGSAGELLEKPIPDTP